MTRKLVEFDATIENVQKVNPLFSTCKVRVMYVGANRNKSTIAKDAVERAIPTLFNIPIVGEFSQENQDFKGHGGAIDLSDYKFIHTTKPYGVVPESATYQWVMTQDQNGITREYLDINGCYLWTGRYEEAESIIENGKGQSMEIEVTDGEWDNSKDSYIIKDFIFSALCILGDDTEPAFEGANITAYSLDKESFKQEYTLMLNELKQSLSKNKEGNDMEKLKQLLEQYSVNMEEVTAEGIVFEGLSEEELEVKFSEVFGKKDQQKQVTNDPNSDDDENEPANEKGGDSQDENAQEVGKKGKKQNNSLSGVGEEDELELEPVIQDKNTDDPSSLKGKVEELDQKDASFEEDPTQVNPVIPKKKNKDNPDSQKAHVEEIEKDAKFSELQEKFEGLQEEFTKLQEENESLKSFKLEVEKADHEAKVEKLFKDFQLVEADVEGIEVHNFSVEELEEKCYAIVGRKLAKKQNFSKNEKGIHLPLNNNGNENTESHSRYGKLFSK